MNEFVVAFFKRNIDQHKTSGINSDSRNHIDEHALWFYKAEQIHFKAFDRLGYRQGNRLMSDAGQLHTKVFRWLGKRHIG